MSKYWTLLAPTNPQDPGSGVPIGYIPQSVLDALIKTPVRIKGMMDFNEAARTVALFHTVQTEPERSALVAKLTHHWREARTFATLAGWRDELFPVYGPRAESLLYSIERAAVGLFGTARYGVHMTAWATRASADDSTSAYAVRVWVSRRAATKSTYPSMLDNTVAGGIATGEVSWAAMLREADEEASISEDVMRTYAKEAGTVSFVYLTDQRSGGESGLVYPECHWVFDLELPAGMVPKPKDGEVEGFRLCTVEEVKDQLGKGLWKPNCALVMIDFFVRHGILTRENEPHYDEIVSKMHRKLPFPGPHETGEWNGSAG